MQPHLWSLVRDVERLAHASIYEEVVAQDTPDRCAQLDGSSSSFAAVGPNASPGKASPQGKAPSARSVALMMVRPAEHKTPEQIAFIDQFCQRDVTIAAAFTLAQAFGQLLRKLEDPQRLEHWKAAVQASGITELSGFVDGLSDDAEAVANGCSESWSNGIVEGFVNKVKWIKRSS